LGGLFPFAAKDIPGKGVVDYSVWRVYNGKSFSDKRQSMKEETGRI
jgi:hypothetical protein